MRLRIVALAFCALACAGRPELAASRTAAPEAAGQGDRQNPQLYRGFQAASVTALAPVFTLNQSDRRKDPRFAEVLGDLATKLPTPLPERWLSLLHGPLANLVASGWYDDANGRRALATLTARVRDLESGDQPQAEVWNESSAGDVRQPPGAIWDIKGFLQRSPGDSTAGIGIPLFAIVTDTARETETFFVFLTEQQAVGIFAVCDLAWRLRRSATDIDAAVRALTESDRGWDHVLQNGYAQYPWENLLNDQLVSSAWNRPPADQFVLLHPEPGAVLDVRRAKTAELDPALLVHGFGYLRYFGAERSWFLGLSATGAITSDQDQGLAYGLTFHVGQSTPEHKLPHVNVGVLWHEGVSHDGVLVSVGVDLLRILSPEKKK